MSNKTFLVEIGTEELPPKALRGLAEAFAANFISELEVAEIICGEVSWFATPRRLALKVKNLSAAQSDREVKKRGPAIQAAFDLNGVPTKSAKGWARSCGINIDQAEYLSTDKGKWLIYRAKIIGQSTKTLLPKIIATSLSKLPILKQMRWGTSKVYFVRPVHTVTLLLGHELIPAKILGINSSRTLRGHRFMGESEFIINTADQYPQLLIDRGKVQPDFAVRKAMMKADVESAATRIGGIADIDESLLEEVTSLVEWPVVLIGQFEKKFLSVPAEALAYTMKKDQKYFPVYDEMGKLLPNFIFVTNIESKYPEKIIIGNERVVRSRLTDAEFFFNKDRKHCLEDNLPRLARVLFHKDLGTLLDKTNRIQALAGWIADQVGANIDYATRAALLSKCDLITNMVFEFTETQGIMGMHYARYHGEVEDVAIAIKEQYRPRFASDKLPSSPVSCALAIADKMDTLVGILGIGQRPKGDKDPFALRRTALGILRILIEKNFPLDLHTLTEKTVRLYGTKLPYNNVIIDNVIDFMLSRFRNWYQKKGYSIDIIQAVLARRPTCPIDFNARIQAVSYFCTLNEATSLIAVNKRVSNILSKTTEQLNDSVQISLMQEYEEIQLATSVSILNDKLTPFFVEGRYQDALIELALLREVVDNFFLKVMVNVEEKEVRVNRLTLLGKLRELFLKIADLSVLH